MVTRGQLLERPVVIPVGERCLDGIYLRGAAPALLVAPPLPGRGGCMANPVGNELAYAAAYAGRASLRLDYRGVGASEGDPSRDPRDAAEDLRWGLDFLLETVAATEAVVAAYLSGAWPALLLAREEPRITRLLLVGAQGEETPPEVPAYGDVPQPIHWLLPGDDPGLDFAAESARADAARNVRLELLPGVTRTFREGLNRLATLVPPLLSAELRP